MAQLISQQFHTALSFLLKKEGRGAQSRLSTQQKIDKGYLNGIIKGRKPGSETVREKIASYFKLTYEEMLILGRQLLEGNKAGEVDAVDKITLPMSSKGKEIVPLDKAKQAAKEKAQHLTKLIQKTTDILGSGTEASQVLTQLINTLHDSIMKNEKNQEQRDKLAVMEKRIETLENMLAKNKKDQRKSA